MQVVGVIPARYHSSRLDGKALADIAGRPMIQHVWERCREAASLDRIILATDDERIETAARSFGAEVVMTDPHHASGTDRIAEAVRDIDCNVVVNIQGDEPMLDPLMIDEVVEPFRNEPGTQFATLGQLIDDEAELNDPNVVKVVRDQRGEALYFSRSLIPHARVAGESQAHPLKHIGLYAYTKECLERFSTLEPTPLEKTERLEQLRALENGIPIRVVLTKSKSRGIGVDTPEDLEAARRLMKPVS